MDEFADNSVNGMTEVFPGNFLEPPEPAPRPVAAGLAYWRSRCRKGLLPGRRDVDPADMTEFLRDIILFDVQAVPRDFRYRLIGTRVREHLFEDRTGQWLSQIPITRPPGEAWTKLSWVADNRRPLFGHTPYVGPHQHFTALTDAVLPLATDGINVDMILCITHFVPKQIRNV